MLGTMGSHFENPVPTLPCQGLNSAGSGAKQPELQSWISHDSSGSFCSYLTFLGFISAVPCN